MHFALILSLVASVAVAAPHANHLVARDKVAIPAFYSPETKAQWAFSEPPKTGTLDLSGLREAALSHLGANLALGEGVDMLQSSAFQDKNGMYHCFVTETVNGVEIANAVANVHLDASGNVISRTSSWVTVEPAQVQRLARRGLEISAEEAVAALAASLGDDVKVAALSVSPAKDAAAGSDKVVVAGVDGVTREITAESKLYKTANDLRSVWEVTMPSGISILNAFVDKETGKVIGSADWTSSADFTHGASHRVITKRESAASASWFSLPSSGSNGSGQLAKRQAGANIPSSSYRAIPFGGKDPRTTKPRLINNPIDKAASPLGWHDIGDGTGSKSTTIGNNVAAIDNRSQRGNAANALAATNFNFDFAVDDVNQSPPDYISGSIANVFFLTNALHDVLHKYGFDEAAGNFQMNNLGKGGRGNDLVIANVQDGSGTNNANFATPPDGQPGVMRMFVFTGTNPDRDGSLENAIVIHELVHGVSNRLTGGPANANCLQNLESGGMGEGWSDIVAVVLETTSKDTRNTDKTVGSYATNNARSGVRRFPYSTSLQRNPLTYSRVPEIQVVHPIGEVWASALFEVYWNMVDKLGFEPNLKDGAKSGKGNTVFLQTLLDAMKIQPCNPTFIQARDAFIRADQANNGGANFCEISKGFAKRGMGSGAVDQQFVDNFDVPARCK